MDICGGTTFGREKRNDLIEMKGSYYSGELCTASPVFYGEKITGEKVSRIEPPSTDYELLESAGAKFAGRTVIELEGGEMKVVNAEHPAGIKQAFPESGVVYVENTKGQTCPKSTPFGGNEVYESGSQYCGDVYVKGYYNKSLTIGAQNDVIIVGNLTEESVGKEAAAKSVAPTGSATLGLIAEEFVRVFHPVKCSFGCQDERDAGKVTGKCNYSNEVAGEGPPEGWGLSHYGAKSGWGSLNSPVIDAGILSTKHSWEVDHFLCGNTLGTLHVWGAIAQFWRGRVCCATTFEPGPGYSKDYNYDERLKTNQPPELPQPDQHRRLENRARDRMTPQG